MALFLPFTENGEKTERAAIALKRKLGLGPYASVDPFSVLPAVPARLVAFDSLPEMVRRDLTEGKGDAWSAIGYGPSPADGHELILLNPTHHGHRQKASLMEELVHVVLDHPKVRLTFEREPWTRPFDADVEDEAFNIGAACVMPYKPLFNAIRHRGTSAKDLATEFGVSPEYVRYRIKRAGLYRVHRKRSTRRGA